MADAYGLPMHDLPDGWQPVEAIMVIKCIQPEGGTKFPYRFAFRATEGLTMMEASGMAEYAHENLKAEMIKEDEDG
jgi:hypothetical protein